MVFCFCGIFVENDDKLWFKDFDLKWLGIGNV